MKIWLLTNSPSPYQLELFEAIARTGACSLHVRFMQKHHAGEAPLEQFHPSFDCRVLKPGITVGRRPELRFQPDAVRELQHNAYDIVILSGLYTNLTFLACAWHLTRTRTPWLMWLEQPWPANYAPAWATRMSTAGSIALSVRNRILGRLLTSTTGTLCIGTAAVQAYHQLGAPLNTLVNFPYHCDTRRFASCDRRDAVRHCLHVDNHLVFLYSGSLIPRKGCDVLLSAFLRLAGETEDSTLLLLGAGASQTDLEAMVPESAKRRVRFLGHRSQSELPDVFQAADVFVFPSRHDGWGVVLNEAAAAGLPIIATHSTGAALDLVEDGKNGFRIPRDDVSALYMAMHHFCHSPASIKAMGRESITRIEPYSLERGATRFCSIIDDMLRNKC